MQKPWITAAIFLACFVLVYLIWYVANCGGPATSPTFEVCFSPRGGCTGAVVREIDAARETVLVQAYSFTSPPIAKALIEASRRGVAVKVIVDRSQGTEEASEADDLAGAGVPVWSDAKHAIAHNKVMILDDETVITGSFNFTRQAEQSNAENLVIIRDKAVAAKFAANWQTHLEHSGPYELHLDRDPDRRGKSSRDGRAPKESKREPARIR